MNPGLNTNQVPVNRPTPTNLVEAAQEMERLRFQRDQVRDVIGMALECLTPEELDILDSAIKGVRNNRPDCQSAQTGFGR
jgi:FixJ family two-component response regulator